MSRKKTYKIYNIDYLLSGNFNEDDLYYFFETKSLTYSLLIEMFKRTNQPITDEKKIIELVKKDNWMYNYFWTTKQCNDYEDILTQVYRNVYYYGPKEAKEHAQWWISLYGLTNDKLKNDKNIGKMSE